LKQEKEIIDLKEGQELRINVEGFGAKNDAFGKYKGMIIFIKLKEEARKGDMINCKIISIKEKFSFAEEI